MSQEPHDDACRKANERLREFNKIKSIIESGYAGVLGNGNIVDRREHPTAIPIPKNSMFNTPEPKDVPQ
jgi:hypothetical protein